MNAFLSVSLTTLRHLATSVKYFTILIMSNYFSSSAFVCLPGRKWVLETGKQYEIIIEVYDKDNHKLHSSDNLRIIGKLPEEYFKIHTQTENGTHYYVTTLQRGNTHLHGKLHGVVDEVSNHYYNHYYNAPNSKSVLPSAAQTRNSTGLKIYTCIVLTLADDQKVFSQPSRRQSWTQEEPPGNARGPKRNPPA